MNSACSCMEQTDSKPWGYRVFFFLNEVFQIPLQAFFVAYTTSECMSLFVHIPSLEMGLIDKAK